ncbi:TIGR02266 family protein [Myxococcus sp. QH3KD-4-1]|nr:TIGR02266 family protein [Myxococcus qinghaiensis]
MSKLLPLRIRLPYSTEEEFVDKYGSNVARGGVFVATRALKPEGTGLAFEFVLADGSRLLRGEGVVVKAQVESGAGRSGMTVRFVKLDAASKALVDRVVARRASPEPQQTVPGLVRKTQAPRAVAPEPPPPVQVPAVSQDVPFAARSAPEAQPLAPESDDLAQGGLFPPDSDDTTEPPRGDHFAPASDEGETPSTALSQHGAPSEQHVEDTGPGLSGEVESAAPPQGAGELSDAAALDASTTVADEASGFGNTPESTSPAWTESAASTEGSAPVATEERELDFDITASLFDADEESPASAVSAPVSGADTASNAFAQEHDTATENAASTFESSSIDGSEAVSNFEAEASRSVSAQAPSDFSGAETSDPVEDTSSEVPWFGTPEVPAWEASPTEVAAATVHATSTEQASVPEDEGSPFSPRDIVDEHSETEGISAAPVRSDAPSSRVESTPTTGAQSDVSYIEATSDSDPWGIASSSSGTEASTTKETSTWSLAERDESNFATDADSSTDPLARIESTTVTASPVDTGHIAANADTDVESMAAALSRIEDEAFATARTEPLANTEARPSTEAPAHAEPSVTTQSTTVTAAQEASGALADTGAAARGTATAPLGPTTAQGSTEHPSTEVRTDDSERASAATTASPTASSVESFGPGSTETRNDSGASTSARASGAPATAAAPGAPQAHANAGEPSSAPATGVPTTSVAPGAPQAHANEGEHFSAPATGVPTTSAAPGLTETRADSGEPSSAPATGVPTTSAAPESTATRTDASASTSALATGVPTTSATPGSAESNTDTRASASAPATGVPTTFATPGSAGRHTDAQESTPTTATGAPATSSVPDSAETRTDARESTSATATGAPTTSVALGTTERAALSSIEARANSSESTSSTVAASPSTTDEPSHRTLAFQAGNTGPVGSIPQAPGTTTPSPAPTEPTSPAPRPITEARTEPTEPPALQDADTARNRRRALLEVPVSAPSTSPSVPEVVLGIDLGTSHARVAVFHEGVARLVPLPGTDGNELPALVAVDGNDELLVGPSAQVEAMRAPRRAAHGLMRLLGLRARSPRLRALAPQLPFPVAADPSGDACVELGGRLVAPTLFTALLLRELKHAATTFVGRKATRAVICAPTHFTDRQRAALRDAATLAGLDAQRILTAPAAAALAHGHGRGLARKRVLVVDLGGGGLGVCVVQVTGDDLEVITTGGDPMVGGLDFDSRIAEALASDLAAQGIPRPEHLLDWGHLRTAAETAKVALSEREQVEVPLSSGTVPPLTRERMEALTADLAQRVTSVVREVLDSNALSPQGLDAVLLVGGQGRTPLVRRRLEESLGVPVRDDVDARGAVALGAALLGHGILLAEGGKPAASVSEVLSAPIGVAERGGTLRRVLERTTRLPAGKTLVIPVAPGPLELALFQGASPLAAENEYLGRLSLNVERAGEVELHFALTADAALSLEATLPGVRRQPVSLSLEDLDDAAREALVARSPLIGEPEARPGGLLSGLKKLFGRR